MCRDFLRLMKRRTRVGLVRQFHHGQFVFLRDVGSESSTTYHATFYFSPMAHQILLCTMFVSIHIMFHYSTVTCCISLKISSAFREHVDFYKACL